MTTDDTTCEIYMHDKGTWDVSSALAKARAGVFGEPVETDLAPLMEALEDPDADKLARIEASPDIMETPLIAVIIDGAALLIDGHHRAHARHRAGHTSVKVWIVPEGQDQDFRLD